MLSVIRKRLLSRNATTDDCTHATRPPPAREPQRCLVAERFLTRDDLKLLPLATIHLVVVQQLAVAYGEHLRTAEWSLEESLDGELVSVPEFSRGDQSSGSAGATRVQNHGYRASEPFKSARSPALMVLISRCRITSCNRRDRLIPEYPPTCPEPRSTPKKDLDSPHEEIQHPPQSLLQNSLGFTFPSRCIAISIPFERREPFCYDFFTLSFAETTQRLSSTNGWLLP